MERYVNVDFSMTIDLLAVGSVYLLIGWLLILLCIWHTWLVHHKEWTAVAFRKWYKRWPVILLLWPILVTSIALDHAIRCIRVISR